MNIKPCKIYWCSTHFSILVKLVSDMASYMDTVCERGRGTHRFVSDWESEMPPPPNRDARTGGIGRMKRPHFLYRVTSAVWGYVLLSWTWMFSS